MNKVFMGLVALVLCALGYVTVKSVLDPVQFDKQQEAREAILQKQLKKIASYQEAYEQVNGRFATAEELTQFLESGRVYYINASGEVTEAMREKGLTEAQAVAMGLIRRDTVWVAAKDSLIKDGTDIATLFDVLSTGNKVKVDTAFLTEVRGKDTIVVSVFRATVPYESYLNDLDKSRMEQKTSFLKFKEESLIQQKFTEKYLTPTALDSCKIHERFYPGLRIGSLAEVKFTGNWE